MGRHCPISLFRQEKFSVVRDVDYTSCGTSCKEVAGEMGEQRKGRLLLTQAKISKDEAAIARNTTA
jgi:hypothetical protein